MYCVIGGRRSARQRGQNAARQALVRWATALGLLAAAIALGWRQSPPAHAQIQLPDRPALDPELVEKLNRRGDLVLDDTPMADTLLRVGELWGVNLVFSKEIEGRVSGSFTRAPLFEILDAVLLSNGYGYRPVGQSLVIVKIAELGDLNPMFATASIRMQNYEPSKVADSLRLLSSPQGKLQAIDLAGMLIVADFPDRVEAIRRLALEMDAAAGGGPGRMGGTQIDVVQFAPQFANVVAMKDPLQAVLSPTGRVAVMPAENRLVVADFPFNLTLAARVVQELDQPRPQVRITALIYDVALKDLERLGVNWQHALKFRNTPGGDPQTLFGGATALQSVPLPGATNGALTLMNLSQHIDLTAVVQALCQAQNSRLLADPNVTVMENEPAVISIVTEIPYQQLTQTQQGGNIGTTAFREAGVKLEVTPQIADDGTIQMNVTPSFSRLTGYTPGDQPQPIIDKREARTTVRVANGQTLVIGGLRQRQEITDENGIPCLKDIKYIGALFRSRSTTYHESELLVFVRPEIVTPFSCGTPREQAAAGMTDSLLSGVPTANSPRVRFPTAPVVIDEEPSGCRPPGAAPLQYDSPVHPAPELELVAPPPLTPPPHTPPPHTPPPHTPPPVTPAPLTPPQRLPPVEAGIPPPAADVAPVEAGIPAPASDVAPAELTLEPPARISEAPLRSSSRRGAEPARLDSPAAVDTSVKAPGEVTPRSVWEQIINGPEPRLRSARQNSPAAPSSRAGRF